MERSNFVDQIRIFCRTGHGGAGSKHFLRTKFNAQAGPDGGDGGRGGNIILKGNKNLWTLLHLRYYKNVLAEDGKGGDKNNSTRYMNQHRKLLLERTKVLEDKLFSSKNFEEMNNVLRDLVELKGVNMRDPQEVQNFLNGLKASAKSRLLTEEARVFLTLPKGQKREEIERRR